MTFYMNLDIHAAFHYWHAWRIGGYRARMIPMCNGRWFVARLLA